MSTQRTFTNEDLTAYLDGEADNTLVRAIDDALKHTPDVRMRLDALRIDRARVAAAFDAMLPLAPTLPNTLGMAEKAPAHRPATGLPWRALAATALISLAIGWCASNVLTRTQTETWQQYAATYHAMYVHDTLAHVRPTPQTTSDELQRVSAALGTAIKTDALASADQLDFRRAQVLGFAGHPVVQIAFVSKTGAPVALCIALTEGSQRTPVRTTSVQGMSAATWSQGRFQYLLIGGTNAAVITASANAFAKAL